MSDIGFFRRRCRVKRSVRIFECLSRRRVSEMQRSEAMQRRKKAAENESRLLLGKNNQAIHIAEPPVHWAAGNSTVNAVPFPASLWTSMVPSWAFTICMHW